MTLKSAIKTISGTAGVAGWSLVERHLTSHQQYRIYDRLESQRTACTDVMQVTIHTAEHHNGKQVQGESSFSVTGGQEVTAEQVALAVTRAKMAANTPYRLPGPEAIATLELADPDIRDTPWQVIDQLTRTLVEGSDPRSLCAAELFADHQRITVVNSSGFHDSYEATELFTEFVLLAEDNHASVECHHMARARRLQELDMAAQVARNRQWVDDRLRAELPPTGTYPVVFGEEALDTLFNTFTAHASGKSRYEGWSRLEEGKPLIEPLQGEALHLTIDPTLPWRLGSRPFDIEGQANRATTLIDQGRFTQRTAEKRYADYLGIPATGSGGTVVVATGQRTLDDLLADGPVIHAQRFSTFHPSLVTGSFSGELRTAYLHQPDGAVIPLTKGSLSGNVWDAFANAHYSVEKTTRSGYQGPAGVRLEGITVAGKA